MTKLQLDFDELFEEQNNIVPWSCGKGRNQEVVSSNPCAGYWKDFLYYLIIKAENKRKRGWDWSISI